MHGPSRLGAHARAQEIVHVKEGLILSEKPGLGKGDQGEGLCLARCVSKSGGKRSLGELGRGAARAAWEPSRSLAERAARGVDAHKYGAVRALASVRPA
jgi:hypothetical protein